MPLPTSRNTTYAPLSQLQSADLNDIQDWIIDHEGRLVRLESQQSLLIHPAAGIKAGPGNGSYVTSDGGYWAAGDTDNTVVHVPIPLRAGYIIQRMVVWAVGGGGTNEHAEANLQAKDPSANTASIALANKTTNTGAIVPLEWVGGGDGLPYTILDERAYVLDILLRQQATNLTRFMGALIDYDIPAA